MKKRRTQSLQSKMKLIIFLFLLLIFSFKPSGLFSQDNVSDFIGVLKNIMNYDLSGYQDMINENTLSYRKPFSITHYLSNFYAIRPYDVFIKCYNKYTNEEFYTRSTLFGTRTIEGYIRYFNPDYVLNITVFSKVNTYRIINRNNGYFVQLQYWDSQTQLPPAISSNELEVVNEFKLVFYKPTGKITKNIDNIFFQFESVEEVQGHLEFDIMDLSNIDLEWEIRKLYNIINTIESIEIRNKYIEKLDFLMSELNNDNDDLLYKLYIVRLVISQFYNIELIDHIR